MDIYSYIKKDHETVAKLFEQAIAAKDAETSVEIFKQIKMELKLHATSEEKTFYEALKKGDEEVQEKEEHAEEEHEEMEELIAKVDAAAKHPVKFLVALGELKHCVEHHVEEEEEEIFKMAKKIISSQEAVELAAEMDEVKQDEKAKMPKAA